MGPRAASWHDMWVTHFKRPEHHRFEGPLRRRGRRADGARRRGCDLRAAPLARTSRSRSSPAGANMATMPKFVSHPLYMVGSDAVLIGDYPSPRTYGAFPIDPGGSSSGRRAGWGWPMPSAR